MKYLVLFAAIVIGNGAFAKQALPFTKVDTLIKAYVQCTKDNATKLVNTTFTPEEVGEKSHTACYSKFVKLRLAAIEYFTSIAPDDKRYAAVTQAETNLSDLAKQSKFQAGQYVAKMRTSKTDP